MLAPLSGENGESESELRSGRFLPFPHLLQSTCRPPAAFCDEASKLSAPSCSVRDKHAHIHRDLQRRQKYVIASPQNTKLPLELNLARNQTPFLLIGCDYATERHQMGLGRPRSRISAQDAVWRPAELRVRNVLSEHPLRRSLSLAAGGNTHFSLRNGAFGFLSGKIALIGSEPVVRGGVARSHYPAP